MQKLLAGQTTKVAEFTEDQPEMKFEKCELFSNGSIEAMNNSLASEIFD